MERPCEQPAADSPLRCLLVLPPSVAAGVLRAVSPQPVLGVRFVDAGADPAAAEASANPDDTVVLHRAMYDAAMAGDAAANARLALVRRLSANRVPLVDSLERVLPFADRAELCRLVQALDPEARPRPPSWPGAKPLALHKHPRTTYSAPLFLYQARDAARHVSLGGGLSSNYNQTASFRTASFPQARQPRYACVDVGEDPATAARTSGMRLPIVVKPRLACGAHFIVAERSRAHHSGAKCCSALRCALCRRSVFAPSRSIVSSGTAT